MNLAERQRQIERSVLLNERWTRSLPLLVGAIERECHRIQGARGARPDHAFPIFALPARTLALLTACILQKQLRRGAQGAASYSDAAQEIRDACYWEWVARKEGSHDLPDIADALSQRNQNRNHRQRTLELRVKVEAFSCSDWRTPAGDALGGVLLEMASELELIRIVTERHGRTAGHKIRRIYSGPALQRKCGVICSDEVGEMERLVAPLASPDSPMISMPRPWEGLHGGGLLSACDTRRPGLSDLVKHRGYQNRMAALQTAHAAGHLNRVYSAVNALQETAWRINQSVYRLMSYAWEHNLGFPDVPTEDELARLEVELPSIRQKLQDLDDRMRKRLAVYQKAQDRSDIVHLLAKEAKSLSTSRIAAVLKKDPVKVNRLLAQLEKQGIVQAQDGKYSLVPDALPGSEFVIPATEGEREYLSEGWKLYFRSIQPLEKSVRTSNLLRSLANRVEVLLDICAQLDNEARYN